MVIAAWARLSIAAPFRCLLTLAFLVGTFGVSATPTTPTDDFTDNLDGTVTHRITGLTWMRCAVGMAWDGTTCAGTASTYTWDQATKLTANFAGQTDWRLPSISELNTIVERDAFNPAINGTIFPDGPSSVWSGSPHVEYTFDAWYVDFGDGYPYEDRSEYTYSARLVRGGQTFDPSTSSTPTSDFYDNSDGTVTHLKTGLMWKRCAEGKTWSDSNCSGNASTFDWATAVALTSNTAGHTDWRIPTVNELLTIVEYKNYRPATNTVIFPNADSPPFWSGSPYPNRASMAWEVDFFSGEAYEGPRSEGNFVRLVREGQFFSPLGFGVRANVAPSSVVTSDPRKIAAGRSGALPISIVGGSYSINGGSYTSAPGTVHANDTVTVRVVSASGYATKTQATLTVGDIGGNFTVTTRETTDSQPPSVPENLTVVAVGDNKISLSWSSASDNVGVTNYRIYRNGLWLTTQIGTDFADAGLTPATNYRYSVAACDAVSNCSAESPAQSATPGNAISIAPVSTTPTRDFNDNGDGTVTHRITGLTWMRCAMGMTWTGATCTGTAGRYTWDQATKLTVNFAGKSDWRVPSIVELNTIVERRTIFPAINTTIFPGTSLSFWTDSLTPGGAWGVDFDFGSARYNAGGNLNAVRLVRGGQAFDSLTPTTPSTDFYDNNDGTVTHLKTGLMWKRCAEGQTWTGATCSGNASTFEWAKAIALTSTTAGYIDWRIPTANELLTIVEYKNFYPAINRSVFPNTDSSSTDRSYFWSGSPYAVSSDFAWSVFFDGGDASGYYRYNHLPVRLVRPGQFFSSLGFSTQTGLALTATITSNPLKVSPVSFAVSPITVAGGQYAINNGAYTSSPGTINPNDTVMVRVTSASIPGTSTRATLTIGSTSGDFEVTTAVDAKPPATPATLTATQLDPAQVKLSWSTASDNTGVTSYRLYRNGYLLATVNTTTTSYTDTQLSGVGPFTYTIEACDAAFNCSALSSPASFTPSAALPITTPKLSAGSGHATALKSDGTLLTWGYNEAGQLGIGTPSDTTDTTNTRSAPQTVGSNTYTAVSAGGSHSAAIQANGNLWTWGGNASGQLGDGTTTSRTNPTQVGTDYMAVAAGNAHTLAIKTNGELWAWGNNGTGQVGDGTSNPAPSPTRIGNGFYTAAAGTSHSVAIKLDGSLWAWGSNNFGQLGDGTGNDRYAPNLIGFGYSAVAAGAFHTIALKTDGTLWAWGKNDNGQLGDTTTQNRYAPVQIGVGFTSVAAGAAHTLALKAGGTLWAWGANESGQLGNGTATRVNQPQQITSASDIISIAAGGNFSLALKRDGSVLSWGTNSTAQLGDGTFGQRRLPVLVVNSAIDGFFNLISGSSTVVPTALKVPFFVSASGAITPKTATVNTTTKFAPTDIGKSGAVFITARVPVGFFGAANLNPNVARNPGITASESTSVLVQLTSTGWKAVINGQLIPYVSGVLGEQTAAQSILDNTDATALVGAEFCVGYGSSADEMVGAGRMRVVATIPGLSATSATTASCLIAVISNGTSPTLAADADAVFAWAERTYAQYFSPAGLGSQSISAHRYRAYKDGHYLAVNENGEAHLYYLGPLSANVFLDLGLLALWLAQAGL
jgi:alpha-tubulin suppressor-like RCC1 family protein